MPRSRIFAWLVSTARFSCTKHRQVVGAGGVLAAGRDGGVSPFFPPSPFCGLLGVTFGVSLRLVFVQNS